ncbi:patatin-like phospholipase family protein [Cumulibacter soli]|uniref:patatin-like phospholipase family protein n=1 Tax=Cumulibacter soli TaxID=2546344 RepID=UPI001ABA4A69|nr:patatin-like phospholipase family protein [Cumulibacter soli]
MNVSTPLSGTRALVLGGGGSTGNAWLIGVLAALSDAGIDVAAADMIVGTSAGATAAAQLAGAEPARLLDAVLAEPTLDAPPNAHSGGIAAAATGDHLERMKALIAESADIAEFRRKMVTRSMAHRASHSESAQRLRRETVAARLPDHRWPERAVRLTAVDALSAEPVVFDRSSGVSLVDAVAASCAGGFAHLIDDHPYIDGGYRANAENADLARPCPSAGALAARRTIVAPRRMGYAPRLAGEAVGDRGECRDHRRAAEIRRVFVRRERDERIAASIGGSCRLRARSSDSGRRQAALDARIPVSPLRGPWHRLPTRTESG